MKAVFTSPDGMCDVYEDDQGQLYLAALCAGIAWNHVGITLDAGEAAAFRSRPESVLSLARSMCFDFAPFRARAIPESVQKEIHAIETGVS